ncbi:MAG: polysaccharide deacetylase family protein [Cyanobacteria bacterium J06621_15]
MNALSISKLHRAEQLRKRTFTNNAIILMYHRIGEPGLDPWSLCVTPKNFEQHLEALQKYSNPMGLRQLTQSHLHESIPQHAVAITFDDGYADNLYNAKPLLERYSIPATVFVTTGHINSQREFWWDELEHLLLQPGKLPEKLTLFIEGNTHNWKLGTAANYTQELYQRDCNSKSWETQAGSRHCFYYSIWQTLRFLPYKIRLEALEAIKTWIGIETRLRSTHRSLSSEELCVLGENQLVEIGSHTVTHSLLSVQSQKSQLREIEQSKAYLEKLLNYSITSFAYPYGNYAPQTISLMQQAGLERACTTNEGMLWKYSDCFQLPRFHVHNWNGEEFTQKLNKWLHVLETKNRKYSYV